LWQRLTREDDTGGDARFVWPVCQLAAIVGGIDVRLVAVGVVVAAQDLAAAYDHLPGENRSKSFACLPALIRLGGDLQVLQHSQLQLSQAKRSFATAVILMCVAHCTDP